MTLFNRYILLSLLVHLLLMISLFIGSWFTFEPDSGQKRIVQAMIIDPDAIERQAQSIREANAAAAKAEQEKATQEQNDLTQEEIRQQQLEEDRQALIAKEQEEKAQREAEIQRKREEEQRREEEARKDAERLANEQAEKLRLEQERLEKERLEKERLEQEKLEQERLAEEQRLEEERKQEEARKEEERLAAEEAEKRRLEQEKLEQEKLAEEKRLAEEQKKEEEKKLQQQDSGGELDNLFDNIDLDETKDIPDQKPTGGVPNAPVTGQNDLGSATEARVLSELDKMKAKYELLIKNHLRNSANYEGKSCQISFKLTPVGKVGLINSPKSLGGDSRLCSETLSALKAIKEFPLHDDPAVVKHLLNNKLEVKL